MTLIRAGFILLASNQAPFPILPPPGGWHYQSIPFLFGLAGVDIVAILLGIVFAGQFIFKGKYNHILGMLSLTIAAASAIVFAAGTVPSGAWQSHPFSYWAMVVLFMPVSLLYLLLLFRDSA